MEEIEAPTCEGDVKETEARRCHLPPWQSHLHPHQGPALERHWWREDQAALWMQVGTNLQWDCHLAELLGAAR